MRREAPSARGARPGTPEGHEDGRRGRVDSVFRWPADPGLCRPPPLIVPLRPRPEQSTDSRSELRIASTISSPSPMRLLLALLALAVACSRSASLPADAAPAGPLAGTWAGDASTATPRPNDAPSVFDAPSVDAAARASDLPADGPPADMRVPRPLTYDGGSCGKPDELCCAGNVCADGGCCVAERCVAQGISCAPFDGSCQNGGCGSCGGRGQPCCRRVYLPVPPTWERRAFPASCTEAGMTCGPDGTCQPCGMAAGEACCAGAICLGPSLVCSATRCTPCGGVGDLCCGDRSCRDGGCCFSGRCVAPGAACSVTQPAAGSCQEGRCSGCGARGQACCNNSTCWDGGPCVGGLCPGCGGAGERCCGQGRKACADGFACLVPTGPGGASQPALASCRKCGGEEELCCDGACADGGCCHLGRCVREGHLCLAENNVGGRCMGGRCQCGEAGEACCASSRATRDCALPRLGCTPDRANRTDRCAPCGAEGGPCCSGSCAAPGTVCIWRDSGNRCLRCGQHGQACCNGETCADPRFDTCVAPPNSSDGSCQSCGGVGEPCCDGNGCTAGSCCLPVNGRPTCLQTGTACPGTVVGRCGGTGSCGTCGGLGQPCCESPLVGIPRYCSQPGTQCNANRCESCGGLGEACCLPFSLGQTGISDKCRPGMVCGNLRKRCELLPSDAGASDAGVPDAGVRDAGGRE
jgi:hypothetical protein